MGRIIIACLWILVAYIWGDWRNWQKYYSTFLFLVVVDLIHTILTYNYTLWSYHENLQILSHHIPNLVIFFLAIYPSTLLIYLSNFPNGIFKQFLYVLGFVTLYTLIEWLALKTGRISYQHGWTLWWSCIVDLLFFPISKIHQTHPIYAWIFAALSFSFFVLVFNIPLSILK